MKATDCKWFACVYATKICSINGWLDSGVTAKCPHFNPDCIRVKCGFCRRENQKDVCPLGGKEE